MRKRWIVGCCLTVSVTFMLSACAINASEARTLRLKANHAQEELAKAIKGGKDVSGIIPEMKRVKILADQGKMQKARLLLDQVLLELHEKNTSSEPGKSPGGLQMFDHPRRVRIVGYGGSAMEPFISRDGKILFFNSEKGDTPGSDKNIYYARRIDDTNFEFMGEVEGVNSSEVDGVPTMDRDGHFYFVSAVNYSRRNRYATVYSGKFRNGRVTDIKSHPELSLNRFGWLNMDVEISADGKTLYATQTYFDFKSHSPPKKSYFFVAHLSGDKFVIDENSDQIFRQINTDDLEYAASISADELELFFTRLTDDHAFGFSSYRATRKSKDEPFSAPARIVAIKGYAEAPALTHDGRLLYFHKKYAGRFHIYVLEREVH